MIETFDPVCVIFKERPQDSFEGSEDDYLRAGAVANALGSEKTEGVSKGEWNPS